MPPGDPVVEASVDIMARPATVWRCLMESDLLSRWLAARATLEPRIGGAVRIDFEQHGTVVEGEVVEIVAERRLAFTWGVTSGPDAATMPRGATRVTIELAPSAGGTLVTLRHAGLPSEQSRRDHEFGWRHYAGQLAQTAFQTQNEAGCDALADAWFAAWAAPDAAARERLLDGKFAVDGTFADVHAATAGRAALVAHIGVCRQAFPGVRMVRDGAVLRARASLLVRWNAVAPDGTTVGSGFNHYRLAPTGEIAAVEGFWAG
jgi:uncharacterized protein YndB with AHSA1/START domain